jgi:hypothetical protein
VEGFSAGFRIPNRCDTTPCSSSSSHHFLLLCIDTRQHILHGVYSIENAVFLESRGRFDRLVAGCVLASQLSSPSFLHLLQYIEENHRVEEEGPEG